MKKAFLVSKNDTISNWLRKQFDIETIDNYDNADLVVFPGGLDVDPALYDEPVGQRTSYNKDTDGTWSSYYRQASQDGKKLLGICKGAQFLTVMSGGRLFQHVTGHGLAGHHSITVGKETYMVTSTHHQMMNPFIMGDDDFEILAVSEERRSSMYLNGYDDDEEAPKHEVEAVFYKGNGSLAIQFHPEFMSVDDPIHKVIKRWLHKTSDYKVKIFFDKWKRKKDPKGEKHSSGSSSYKTVTESAFNEFVNYYLK